ncbi:MULTISPECIES: ROK family protein [Galbibacter]|uniref:ROK family protein n=1 Tax=Galbibacter pacificus TaxID=2996052 RepID=A0ABT6FVV6_9FLAO|nr:ROK family protein [Galbibacter pacificus]MDG3583853.1 ROK family protein [Galbibacter pacificus]MDG3587229.1 ROK family protein [Galbibacter pacificus]
MPIVIGVDIGGSHVSCAAVNTNTNTILPETYFQNEVNSKASKETILQTWGDTINQVLKIFKGKQIEGIGFAMPGPFKYKEGIAMFEVNDKYESLYNVSVLNELPKYVSAKNIKLRFLNDASSFGLGSLLCGGIKTDKKVIAITLGTGFGAAFFDGDMPILTGNEVPENGCLWDKPYKNGISDDYFSTRWFINAYEEYNGNNDIYGVKEIIDEEKEVAKVLFKKFTVNLCEFMLPYINKFQPDLLIIGGSIAKSSSLFLPDLKEAFSEAGMDLSIQIISNTEEANIIGAAYALNDSFWKKIELILPKI